jgi:hypothetical protein
MMHSHFTMTFHSFQFSTLTHHSNPRQNSLHFTSLHFLMISSTTSLHLIYHFPNTFANITWFTGESDKSEDFIYHVNVISREDGPLNNNRRLWFLLSSSALPWIRIKGAENVWTGSSPLESGSANTDASVFVVILSLQDISYCTSQ